MHDQERDIQSRIQHELAVTARDSLPATCGLFATGFLIIAALHATGPHPGSFGLAVLKSSISTLVAACALMFWRRPAAVHLAHPILLGLVLLGLMHNVTTRLVLPDVNVDFGFALFTIICGLVFLSTRWFMCALAIVAVVYAMVEAFIPSRHEGLRAVVFASGLTSVMVHMVLARTHTKLQRARISDEQTNQKLQAELQERRQLESALRAATDNAQAANRAKSEFLANMSHELRTPLNGVLGYVQILRRDSELNARQKESLASIESCGQHLLTLINDVLDLSRIESGEIEIESASCDLHRLLESVCDVVRQKAENKGIGLRLSVAAEVPRGIVIDQAKLRQVLINLLGNAVKFTEQGSVTVNVAENGPAGQLVLSVEDTGAGIPTDKLTEIFDAFKQAEAGKSAGGTGLGLSISRRLVDAMGGSLTATSQLNEGSQFEVRLPLVPVPDEEIVPDDESLMDGSTLHLASGQTLTVLVADDRATNRDILVQLLASAGIKALEAENGRDALDQLRRQRMPIVLMDIRMPVMNGLEATRCIREDEELRETKIIAVSASVFPDSEERLIDAGFDAFIRKPLRAADLFYQLQQHAGVKFVDRDECKEVDPVPEELPRLGADRAGEIASRIKGAVEIGNVTELTELANELSEQEDPSSAYARLIHELVTEFDFEGLGGLVDRLEAMVTP